MGIYGWDYVTHACEFEPCQAVQDRRRSLAFPIFLVESHDAVRLPFVSPVWTRHGELDERGMEMLLLITPRSRRARHLLYIFQNTAFEL